MLSQFIAPDAVEDHLKIMENLKNVESAIQPFKADTRVSKISLQISII